MRSLIAERAPLLPVVVFLVLGIVAGFLLKASITLLPFFIGMVILAFLLHRWAVLQSLAILLSISLLGMILATHQWQKVHRISYDGQRRDLNVVVASEPSVKPRSVAVDVLSLHNGQKLRCYLAPGERALRLQPGDGLSFQQVKVGDCGVLRRQGFVGQCYVPEQYWSVFSHPSLSRLSVSDRSRLRFLRWRHVLLQRYRLLGARDDSYAVLAAMTLGDKSALSRELRDTYSVTGASHILALSGLHLGILYMLLSYLLLSHYRQRLWSQVVLVLSVWSFAFLVGLPVSVVRSATMISLFALFSVGHRPHLSVNLLCLAALIILLLNPYSLFDVGFQLSFVSVASILLLLPLFAPDPFPQVESTSSPTVFQRLSSVLVSMLAVSLAAQVGVAPLVAFHFGHFSTYFLLTNLIVLPAAYLVLCGTLLMLLLPFFAPAVLWLVGGLNHILTWVAQLPLSSINDLHPSWIQVVAYYLMVASLSGALWVWRGRWSWD